MNTLEDQTLVDLIAEFSHRRLHTLARAIWQTFSQLTRIVVTQLLIVRGRHERIVESPSGHILLLDIRPSDRNVLVHVAVKSGSAHGHCCRDCGDSRSRAAALFDH